MSRFARTSGRGCRVEPFVLVAAMVVASSLASSANAFEVRATFRRVDREQHQATVVANGNEHTARVSESVEVIGADGKELPERFQAKVVAEGATALLTVEQIGGRPTIVRIDFSNPPRRNAPDRGERRGPVAARPSTGLKPLCDMSADDRYQGEEGGLYGAGRNEPAEQHRTAALQTATHIQPRNAAGEPVPTGKIAYISISMSNATQEFSAFKRLSDDDPRRSPRVVVVDCAQGGQAMAEWAATPPARGANNSESDPRRRSPWQEADDRLTRAGVSSQQVQVAWVKIANKGPRGDLSEHGKRLAEDVTRVLQFAQQRFPNLRIVYLSSRIYGGYAESNLNPEPYAYESGFVARGLIRKQQTGDAALQFDPKQGDVKAPLLLWGPYLWADGVAGRNTDDLVWNRDDLAGDGTHPSNTGRQKVAQLLLEHVRTDPSARSWYLK